MTVARCPSGVPYRTNLAELGKATLDDHKVDLKEEKE
jgi:hypothetical protein